MEHLLIVRPVSFLVFKDFCKIYRIKKLAAQNSHRQSSFGFSKILFSLEIFDAVERDGRNNDQAFDYELQIRVNHQEREAIC